MQVESTIHHNGEKITITKNIKRINVIYVDRDKHLYYFQTPFLEFPEWCHITIRNQTFAFSKKNICWKYNKKLLSFRRNACWEPYVIMFDQNAYNAMMP